MLINISPKKINRASDLRISVTFKHQGVAYEERYKTKGYAINAIKKKKDMFVSLVDLNEMRVVHRDDLKSYMGA